MHRAGIVGPQATAKALRYSWGVAAVQAGVPLTTIATVLGHANVSTAALYTTALYTTASGAEAHELRPTSMAGLPERRVSPLRCIRMSRTREPYLSPDEGESNLRP